MITVVGSGLAFAWVLLALAGGAHVGAADVTPFAAAAACGATLLATAWPPPGELLPVFAVAGVPVVVAEAARGGTALPLAVAVGAIAAWALLRRNDEPVTAVLAAAGTVTLVVGLAIGTDGHLAPHRTTAGVVLLVAAACLGAAGLGSTARLAAAPALLVAMVAAPHVPALPLIAAAGAAAVACAAVGRAWPAIALVAVAASAFPPARPAGGLLAAAALLVCVLDVAPAVVAALPGAVALAAAVASGPIQSRGAVLAVATAAVAGLLARGAKGPADLHAERMPAAAATVWLVVAPGSWTWAGPVALAAYDRGAAAAVAVALLVLVLGWMTGQAPLPAALRRPLEPGR